jgi:hypothetical protein
MIEMRGSPTVRVGVNQPHRRRMMPLGQSGSRRGAAMVSIDVLHVHLVFLSKSDLKKCNRLGAMVLD